MRRVSKRNRNRSDDRAWETNRYSFVKNTFTKDGKLRTFTAKRDPDTLRVSVVTDSNNSTKLTIAGAEGEVLVLNGREARTLLRVLSKHADERETQDF